MWIEVQLSKLTPIPKLPDLTKQSIGLPWSKGRCSITFLYFKRTVYNLHLKFSEPKQHFPCQGAGNFPSAVFFCLRICDAKVTSVVPGMVPSVVFVKPRNFHVFASPFNSKLKLKLNSNSKSLGRWSKFLID